MHASTSFSARIVLILMLATLVSALAGAVAGALIAGAALHQTAVIHAPAQVTPDEVELPQVSARAGEL